MGCGNNQIEPDCKQSSSLTDEYAASEIHESLESGEGCLAMTDSGRKTVQDNIVPLEGKPYFTSVMGQSSVCRRFILNIPKRFSQYLPKDSTWTELRCREKKWIVKYNSYKRMKCMKEGWKEFVTDNNLKVGDGCVFELINSNITNNSNDNNSNNEPKIKVQIVSGELPARALPARACSSSVEDGRSSDNPIYID